MKKKSDDFISLLFSALKEDTNSASLWMKENARNLVSLMRLLFICICATCISNSIEKSVAIILTFLAFHIMGKMLNHASIGNDIPVRKTRYTRHSRLGVELPQELADDAIVYLCEIEDYLQRTGKAVYKE